MLLQRSPLLILLGTPGDVTALVLLLPALKLLLHEGARVLDVAHDGAGVGLGGGGIDGPGRNILNGAAMGSRLGEGGRPSHAMGDKLGETNPAAEGGKVEDAGLEVLANSRDEEVPLQGGGKPCGSEEGDGDKDQTHGFHHATLLGGHVRNGFLGQRHLMLAMHVSYTDSIKGQLTLIAATNRQALAMGRAKKGSATVRSGNHRMPPVSRLSTGRAAIPRMRRNMPKPMGTWTKGMKTLK